MIKINMIIQKDKKALHHADNMHAKACYLKAARRYVGVPQTRPFASLGKNSHQVH